MTSGRVLREAASNQSAPINRSYLDRFTLGNVALEREVLQLFAQQIPPYLEQLRSADSQEAWKLAAHTIKGSALAIGADRLASVARLAECLDYDASSSEQEDLRRQAAETVAVAAEEVCDYIACLFATG